MIRILALCTLWLTMVQGLAAQVVTTNPAFPLETSQITITFDASQGTGGLAGFTGDIYAHTGVLTNLSNTDSDWRYVIADWGVNIPKAKLTRIEGDIYELIIDNPRDYYDVPEGETIRKLAFVFRSAAAVGGSFLEGKDEGGGDIFIDIFQPELNVRFVQPGTPYSIVELNEVIDFIGIGGGIDTTITLSISIDGQEMASIENDTITYSYTASVDGTLEIYLVGEGADGSIDSALHTVNILPEISNTPRPEGLEDGITYNSETSVTFSLFAPGKQFVYLIGDFNDWQISEEFLMNRESDGNGNTWFWFTLDNLTADTQYGFQYVVDGIIRVADPYSELVLDGFNDQFIPEASYPNIHPYPTGKTEFQVGVIHPGKPEYQWEVTDFSIGDPDSLVIYELLVRDFIEARSYDAIIDTLGYLQRLGINAIELMPVSEFDGNLSWGYNPSFHMALDKFYGTPNSFKRFVDECHKRGIAVLLDVVYNHATGSSPLIRMWGQGDYGPPTEDSPYANVRAKHPFNVFYDLNHESAATQYWLDKVNAYWLEEYKVDGYRFDLSKGFTQVDYGEDVGRWSGYDGSRVRLIKRMTDKMREVNPNVLIILEHFGGDREEGEYSEYGLYVWGNENHSYNEATMGWHDNSDIQRAYFGRRGFTNSTLVSFMESHDEERMLYRNVNFGNNAGGHNTRDKSVALERIKAAASLLFPIPGPKMLWQFGELGYDVSINQNQVGGPVDEGFRTSEKPILWEYYDDEERFALYRTFSELIKLRKSDPLFYDGDSRLLMDPAGSVKKLILSRGDDHAVVVANLGFNTTTEVVNMPANGTYYNFFKGNEAILVENNQYGFELRPSEFMLVTTKEYPAPELGLVLTDIEQNQDQLPREISLKQNYPNPFNPSTQITFSLPQTTEVSLKVFDMMGREVATLRQGSMAAGSHTVTFMANNLSSGMYFLRLQAQGRSFTKKMMLIK